MGRAVLKMLGTGKMLEDLDRVAEGRGFLNAEWHPYHPLPFFRSPSISVEPTLESGELYVLRAY
jgi:hypothetical protein